MIYWNRDYIDTEKSNSYIIRTTNENVCVELSHFNDARFLAHDFDILYLAGFNHVFDGVRTSINLSLCKFQYFNENEEWVDLIVTEEIDSIFKKIFWNEPSDINYNFDYISNIDYETNSVSSLSFIIYEKYKCGIRIVFETNVNYSFITIDKIRTLTNVYEFNGVNKTMAEIFLEALSSADVMIQNNFTKSVENSRTKYVIKNGLLLKRSEEFLDISDCDIHLLDDGRGAFLFSNHPFININNPSGTAEYYNEDMSLLLTSNQNKLTFTNIYMPSLNKEGDISSLKGCFIFLACGSNLINTNFIPQEDWFNINFVTSYIHDSEGLLNINYDLPKIENVVVDNISFYNSYNLLEINDSYVKDYRISLKGKNNTIFGAFTTSYLQNLSLNFDNCIIDTGDFLIWGLFYSNLSSVVIEDTKFVNSNEKSINTNNNTSKINALWINSLKINVVDVGGLPINSVIVNIKNSMGYTNSYEKLFKYGVTPLTTGYLKQPAIYLEKKQNLRKIYFKNSLYSFEDLSKINIGDILLSSYFGIVEVSGNPETDKYTVNDGIEYSLEFDKILNYYDLNSYSFLNTSITTFRGNETIYRRINNILTDENGETEKIYLPNQFMFKYFEENAEVTTIKNNILTPFTITLSKFGYETQTIIYDNPKANDELTIVMSEGGGGMSIVPDRIATNRIGGKRNV